LEIIELYPNPLPPPPRFDRGAALAGLQTAFALLTDDELRIARVRMLGVRLTDIAATFRLSTEEVEKLWKQARRKLGNTLFGEREVGPGQDQPGG
jgi:DNA-directed RNA polymerase specialized sigma24 family protein